MQQPAPEMRCAARDSQLPAQRSRDIAMSSLARQMYGCFVDVPRRTTRGGGTGSGRETTSLLAAGGREMTAHDRERHARPGRRGGLHTGLPIQTHRPAAASSLAQRTPCDRLATVPRRAIGDEQGTRLLQGSVSSGRPGGALLVLGEVLETDRCAGSGAKFDIQAGSAVPACRRSRVGAARMCHRRACCPVLWV
jgi:general stress protein YciG